jgi:hypothetical protein
LRNLHADLLQQRPHNPLLFDEERLEQVQRQQLLMPFVLGLHLSLLHRLLRLNRQLVEPKRHDRTSSSSP